jgi:hypothetical protein
MLLACRINEFQFSRDSRRLHALEMRYSITSGHGRAGPKLAIEVWIENTDEDCFDH